MRRLQPWFAHSLLLVFFAPVAQATIYRQDLGHASGDTAWTDSAVASVAQHSTNPTARRDVACTVDQECSLNGHCVSGVCKCARPWSGPTCAVLNRGRASSRAAAGIYGYTAPNVTSWGVISCRTTRGGIISSSRRLAGGVGWGLGGLTRAWPMLSPPLE